MGRLVPRQGKFSSEKDERLNINAMFRIVSCEMKIMIVILPENQVGQDDQLKWSFHAAAYGSDLMCLTKC